MEEKLLKELEILSKRHDFSDGGYFDFPEQGYKTFYITKANFHDIKKSSSALRVAFIDGGNAEVLRSQSFSYQMVKMFCSVYHGKKRLQSKEQSFFLLASSEAKDGKLWYRGSLSKNDLLQDDELLTDSNNLLLKEGPFRAKIARVGDMARRFAEIRTAKQLVDAKACDAVMLDGTLQATLPNEKEALQELYDSAMKNKVAVCALAKSTNLFTNSGASASDVLKRLGPAGPWSYHPIADISVDSHKADIHFLKLHQKSRHVFRLEISKGQDGSDVICALKDLSMDPVFLGYPYPLIEADKFARVTNKERDFLKTKILTKMPWIEEHLSSLDAHDVLDSM